MTELSGVSIRGIREGDAGPIARIDARHTGIERLDWWEDVVSRHADGARHPGRERVGLVAVYGPENEVVGYVLGQVRAFEFGSEPCGWIFAVGVDPRFLHHGVGSQLFQEARRRFAAIGVTLLRTMVRREDIPVLTFFRNQGFMAGPYVELELDSGEVDTDRVPGSSGGLEGVSR